MMREAKGKLFKNEKVIGVTKWLNIKRGES